MINVLLKKRIHRATVLTRCVLEMQQHADFIECHVQAAAMPDEGKTLDVAAIVDSVIAFRTYRRRQQTLPLVVANGLCLGAGGLGQFADLHGTSFANGGSA